MIRGRSSRSSRLRVSVGRTAVAQQQRADVAFGLGLRDAPRRGRRTRRGPEPDVAVRVDQAGEDPAAVEDGVGAGDRLGAEHAVDDPPFDGLPVGQPAAAHVQDAHRASATSCRGTSAWTGRSRPGRAAARRGPWACCDRSGKPAGMPRVRRRAGCAPSAASGPRPPFLPFLFLPLAGLARRDSCGRTGMPIWPAIDDIILRASKNRSTSWLTSTTVTPEPLAMRSRREALMIFGSARSCGRHAADDGLHAVELLVVDRGQRVLHLAGAGQHAQQVADRAHLADRQHLLEEVLERELAGADLGGGGLGLLGVEDLLGLLDQASARRPCRGCGWPSGRGGRRRSPRASRRWTRTGSARR